MSRTLVFVLPLLLMVLFPACTQREEPGTAGAPPSDSLLVIQKGFIFEEAPFASAHASTIVETPLGWAVAWFGGTDEGNPDVGIWFSRHDGDRWSAPVEVATGVQTDGTRYPCWNPVLFRPPAGPLVLFYKVGPNPRAWWGMVKISIDLGSTWSEAAPLPDGILGPVRAKPLLMSDGSLLAGSSTEHDGWVVHMERYVASAEGGELWSLGRLAAPVAWTRTGPLNDASEFEAIQPSILLHSPDRLQILCRSGQGVVTQAWSEDGGLTWGPMTATGLPNPNAGVDAVRLADGRYLLIYNPTTEGRSQLGLAVSSDGVDWEPVTLLEDAPGEYSYPAMVQGEDGFVYITYTWQRKRIAYAVIDPAAIGV